MASDGEVVVVAIPPFRLGSILELGAILWGSALSSVRLSWGVNKAYSPDEVVCVEVVLWRWWVWSVEIEGVLRVKCLELGSVYLYPYHWLKHHLLALLVVSVCPLVAIALARHCLCTPSSRVSYANQFDNLSGSTTFVLG